MKKIYSIIITTFLIVHQGLGQERAFNHELDTDLSGESKHYVARESIKLTNGFTYQSGTNLDFKGQLRNFELQALHESTLTNAQGGSNNNGLVGATPGSFNIGSTGSVSYNIPILVSPGTADMEPNLSISYNSQAKNGIMGYGFNLSGLSAISRMPSSDYLDGQRDAVGFDANDKLAIDGERLILVSGTYGAAGSEYRTENNRFAKIKAYDTQGSSNFPKQFKVWEKSGLIKYYGYHTDARIGDSSLGYHSWLLTRVEDRKGNYIAIEYTKTTSTYYPKKISYTGNDLTGTTPYATVEFEYTSRSDDPFYYVGGHKQALTKLLSGIKCKYGTTVFREYQLTYDTYDDIPHLSSVTEKNGVGEAFNPIQFDWNHLTRDLAVASDRPLAEVWVSRSRNPDLKIQQFAGDFTGNGVADLLVISLEEYVDNLEVHKWRLYEYQNNELILINEGNITGPDHAYYMGDFNADGLTDFIEIEDSGEYRTYKIYEATGNGFTRTQTGDIRIPQPALLEDWAYVSDFDGDGYADLMYNTLNQAEGQPAWWMAYVFFNYNTSFQQDSGHLIRFQPDFENTGFHGNELQLGDYNGDGMTDIYVGLKLNQTVYNNTYHSLSGNESCIYFATGNRVDGQAFTFSQSENLPEITNENIAGNVIQGDYNGDGKMDFLVRYADTVQVGQNVTGACIPCGSSVPAPCDACPNGSTCNLSGECVEPIYANNWHIYYGTGLGFEMVEVDKISGVDDYDIFPVDIAGEGKTSLAFAPRDSWGPVKIYHLNQTSWSQIESFSKSDKSKLLTGDFTGNGTTDFLEMKKSILVPDGDGTRRREWHYRFLTDYQKEKSLVKTITNSRGALMLIDYLPMTNPDIHTLDQSLTDDQVIGAQFPVYLASAVYADNGLGGLSKTTYHYEGSAIHRKGRGFLGFQKMTTKNITSQTKTVQHYSYDKHNLYVPQLDKQVVYSIVNGNKLSQQDMTYQNMNDGYADTYVLAQDRSIVEKYDPNTGALISRLTTDYNTYDSYGNIKEMVQTYSSGHMVTTSNVYQTPNTANWLISRLKSASVTKTAPGQTPSTRNSAFTYNAQGYLLTETIEPGHLLELTTTYGYDNFGNVISSTVTGDGGTRTDYSTYDSEGRLLMSTTNALGHVASFTYDPVSGTIETSTDANGLVTTQEYDNFNRLIKVIDPLGNTAETLYSWDVTGGPSGARYSTTVTASDGGEQKVFYDRLGRELCSQAKSFDGQFIQVDKVYNKKGQVEKQSDPYFSGNIVYWHEPTYDAFGRIEQTESPGDRIMQNSYGTYSTTTTNAKQQNNSATVDAFDQLTTTTNHQGKTLTYGYYASGQVHAITDSKGNTTTFEYDQLGNKTKTIDPDLGTLTYEYNAFGQPTKQTDGAGASTEFTYDDLGRPLSRTITKAGIVESTNWVYDTQWKGTVTSITQSNGISKTYAYDTYGQVIEESEQIEGQTYSTYYSYTSEGKLDVLTYPSGFEVKHLYNANGFLASVKDPNGPTVYWQATYLNARGQYESYQLGNGVSISHTFDPKTAHLTEIQAEYNQTLLQDMSFTHDLLSNLTSRSDHLADGGLGLTETFAYDNLNRLIRSEITEKNYGALDMTYDELGNLTYKSDVGYYHYEGTKPHAVSRVDNTGSSIPSTVQTISYTGFNKVSLITEGFSALEFIYGAGHERKVTKTYIDGSLTQTKVFAGLYEKQINEEGEDRELHYIQGGSGTIAIHTIEGANSQTHYLLKDHLGTITGIIDEAGAVLERYSYDAWGKRRDADSWDVLSGAINDKYDRGFTGHEHLHLFSLINMNGRVYDPVLGRFLSADPFTQFPNNLQSYNRYSYVLNNPLSLTDPSGYFSLGDFIGSVLNYGITAILTIAGVPYQYAAAAGAFVGTFAGSLIDGASIGDALYAATVNAMYAVAGATFTHGIGKAFGHEVGTVGHELRRGLSHASAQGFLSFSRGGNFWHGFASGGISSLAGSASAKIDNFGVELAISSTAGGASAAVVGGSFTDGAITGAYVHMFNHWGAKWKRNRLIKEREKKFGRGALGYQRQTNGGSGTSADFLLAKLYGHFQIGGGDDFHLDATTLDFSGTNQRELGLTDLRIGDDPILVNLFESGIDSKSLAFGRVHMERVSDTEFHILNNTFDFTPLWDQNASLGRNLGNLGGAAVNYNIAPSLILRSPIPTLIPMIFGGGFEVIFNGNVTIPR